MHSLDQIIRMNNRAAEKVEDNHNRHCSFNGDARQGVVLHSAKHRATVVLEGSLKSSRAAATFLAKWWSVNSQDARNQLVESYF